MVAEEIEAAVVAFLVHAVRKRVGGQFAAGAVVSLVVHLVSDVLEVGFDGGLAAEQIGGHLSLFESEGV